MTKITKYCDWCGAVHTKQFSTVRFEWAPGSSTIGDVVQEDLTSELCPKCYKGKLKAFKNQSDIVAGRIISVNVFISSIFTALILGLLIGITITLWQTKIY